MHPKCKEAKNAEDKKPHEVFTESHRELVKAGEKWAKGTAGSFTLVAGYSHHYYHVRCGLHCPWRKQLGKWNTPFVA